MTDVVAAPAMSADEARRLTEKIRLTAHTYTESREKLIGYVERAKAGSAHLALGYPSWTAYLADVLGEEPMRLARDERREVVQLLSGEGMSTRAIAPIVGVTFQQVAKDQVSPEATPVVPSTPTVETRDGVTIADSRHINLDDPPRPVTGLDGKTYPRAEPKPVTETPAETAARLADALPEKRETRRPITDAFWETAYDLSKKVDTLARLISDDRFAKNREAIASKNLRTLRQTASTFAEVLAAIESN